jgi:hypothetical protein
VFESRALRRIFATKRVEMTGGWRKMHSDEYSPSIIRMIKSRRII